MVDHVDEIAAETTRQLGDREADDFNAVKATVAGAILKGIELERERCAKIAEADAEAQGPLGCGPYAATHSRSIARAIRGHG